MYCCETDDSTIVSRTVFLKMTDLRTSSSNKLRNTTQKLAWWRNVWLEDAIRVAKYSCITTYSIIKEPGIVKLCVVIISKRISEELAGGGSKYWRCCSSTCRTRHALVKDIFSYERRPEIVVFMSTGSIIDVTVNGVVKRIVELTSTWISRTDNTLLRVKKSASHCYLG